MSRFDTILVVDWSARAVPSPAAPSPDSVWIGCVEAQGMTSAYHRTRGEAEAALHERVDALVAADRRSLLCLDFAFGYPAPFAQRLTGHAHAFAVWDWLEAQIVDGPDNANNRYEVADAMNAQFPGQGPFWGHPQGRTYAHLTMRDARSGHGVADEKRLTERLADGHPQSPFKLAGAGAVGGQTLTGLPMLARLRRRYEARLGVWPFEDHALDRQIVLAEVWPSLLAVTPGEGEVRDDIQVRALAAALDRMQQEGSLDAAFAAAHGDALHEEGWILGVGVEEALRAAAHGSVHPRLGNDCFALPPGVDWTPVDEALARLRGSLSCVTGAEAVPIAAAEGRVLVAAARADRANPPAANAAVDGYGFASGATGEGPQSLPLVEGRAAAGQPSPGSVPEGRAVRILTGAILPEGVDTVILQEDAAVEDGQVTFNGPVRPGANTRKAGEDVAAGVTLLPPGHVLRPPDLALLAATGIARVEVRRRLRVGVLSTGDELAEPGVAAEPELTYDANRPMLLALMRRWGHEAVDLGHARDDRGGLRQRLDRAAEGVDAILTSGGASAGDEDHVSALLREAGSLDLWRIAVKPGRPLALGLWRGVPVFGLPGNPVAAFVCTLIFARPSLGVLAGATWSEPQGFEVPAAFEKRKKPGRREYLRARLREGRAEIFASEGSGRISGLSWADGLVELGDGAAQVRPGDSVRFLPYGSFGL
ncbi:molybdopterin-binding protein [Roseitranquillus sediminis]|uniref:molybdopterin-binding protein n=1 Tax=Roseitranquillus sediminis TaxID=2809051 RepID=UPI001D0BF762|nr:gephyrin-like molybdotransferase Glp [Roseitranquillus sediminis]MBM9593326.1 molybdopterin molybdenumtransferase MoeA [Roseitranquillus sediminis]